MKNPGYDVSKVKYWLLEYKENEKDVEYQLERIERLQARLEKCNAPEITDMPRAPSPPTDKMSIMIAKKLDMEKRLQNFLEKQGIYLDRIEYLICKLLNASESAIIRMRYEDALQWSMILYYMYGKEPDYLEREESLLRTVYLIHGEALLKIAKYLQDSGDPEVAFFEEYIPKSPAYQNYTS